MEAGSRYAYKGNLEPAYGIRGMEIRERYATGPGLTGRSQEEAISLHLHRIWPVIGLAQCERTS